jgi:hypothetical protein
LQDGRAGMQYIIFISICCSTSTASCCHYKAVKHM